MMMPISWGRSMPVKPDVRPEILPPLPVVDLSALPCCRECGLVLQGEPAWVTEAGELECLPCHDFLDE